VSKRTKVHIQFKAGTDSSASSLGNALYIIDGVSQEGKLGNKKVDISPEEIESISVLKGQEAAATYGKEGENGVILITTKEKAKGVEGARKIILKSDRIVRKVEVAEEQKNGNRFSVLGIDANLSNRKSMSGFNIKGTKDGPLILIDGKEVDEEFMKKINPDQIEVVTVFKDKEAIKQYGEKGENGVVLIELKEGGHL
jgi:TonB-dependent SusC/RagA subfamily outer membrane receptor